MNDERPAQTTASVKASVSAGDWSPPPADNAEPKASEPTRLVELDCESIKPEALTLIAIDQDQINRIVQTVPGGAKNVQDIYPLSPLQEGMLFYHLLHANDTYVISTLFEVQSQAQIGVLINAIQKVIDRHHAMRSAVIWKESPQPVQVVYRHATLPVEELVLDVNRDPVDQLNDWTRPERLGMNLQHAPLLRMQVAADPHRPLWYAVLQIHHLVCDHQTLNSVVAEAMAYVRGGEGDLPTPSSYREFVAGALAQANTKDAEAFFRNKFGDVDEPTAPFGLLDAHGDGGQVEEVCQMLEPGLTGRIRMQSRNLGVSPARLFHAAWALVVATSTGRSDIVYGTVLLASSRKEARSKSMLGLFVNTLPLRLRLERVTAKELIEQTSQELRELLNYEHASLAMAQSCSANSGAMPLFTSVLNYRRSVGHSVIDPKAPCMNVTGIKVLALQYRTNYPIELSVDDLGDEFSLTAHVERKIDPHRILRFMHTAVGSLLDALERAPQTPALELPILPKSERHELIKLFNATQRAYSHNKLIHEMLEDQVLRSSEAVAVEHGEESLTYAQLNNKANQLARHLRRRRVGPDQLVGICVERSLEMVVGLLGILKAGGAYVPLDPNYPFERLRYMLEDAAPRVVLTQENLRATLPVTEAEVIALDTELGKIVDHPENNLSAAELGLTAQNLVYVIYTSGSTGRPKGAAMSHRSMVNLVEWHQESFQESRGRRVLQFAALSFDVAFQEVFSTLCTGGTLVLLDEWIRRDARALIELLRDRAIDRLFLPPLMLQNLSENFMTARSAPLYLKDVITAGEQLRISPEIVRLFKSIDACRLHNHYGPTEAHVVTAFTMNVSPEKWPTLPTIGKPIANTQIYILDGRRQPAPLGVGGEIYIGGVSVARGYLNRPELTAERFVPDPFSVDSQLWMYRTGDRARWRADGTIDYLGRNDDQVKVRSFRIEVGEIEAHLALHPKVKEIAVIAREDGDGGRRLVAYITQRGEISLAADELRAHARASLPDHMVPSAFVVLDNLPRAPSGKLDRRALPAPERDAYATREYEAPQGELEEALAGIWRSLLHVKQVGRHDTFFELGGNSLTAMNLMTRVANTFAIPFQIQVVLRNPTFWTMARLVEGLRSEAPKYVPSSQVDLEEGVI